jgi:purine nucleosidase
MTTKQKIIIDTDPGQDDAVAILLALASPDELDLLGIVAVAGNVPLSFTASNARKVLELGGRPDIPVHAGCRRPMLRVPRTAEYVHGPTGLNGPDLPEPKMPLGAQHGVDWLIDTVMAHEPGSITLCTLGPLTNIGMAFVKAPEIAPRLKRIVMMAGAYFEVGNVTPTAEFNVYVDPEAADVVMRSGVPIVMLPLDVTHQVLSTRERITAFRALNNRTGKAVAEMLTFSQAFDVKKYGWAGGPLHDPNVIAWLLAPDLYQGRDINVSIETDSALTLGMTVADWWGVTDRPRNATYLRNVDANGFYRLLTERLARLP